MRRTIPLIATLAALLLAAPAVADMTNVIVHDCQHSQTGYLTGTYTTAQLRKAKNNLPSDVLEYSGCYDQISQALRDATSGGSGGGPSGGDGSTGGSGTGDGGIAGGDGGDGTSGGSTTPVAPAAPHVGTRTAVEIAGTAVQPGTIPAIGEDAHTLPTPLLVALVLLGLGALVPLATTTVRRVIARRGA